MSGVVRRTCGRFHGSLSLALRSASIARGYWQNCNQLQLDQQHSGEQQGNPFQSFTLRHHTSFAANTNATSGGSLDPQEAAKFAALSASWWNASGPFAPLHRLNPARCKFIRAAVCSSHGIPKDNPEPLQGFHALDVGCGGGILAESLARMGAKVHAIDITQENIQAAQSHAVLDPMIHSRIRYECISAEDLMARGDRFDLVMASEVVEHVRRPEQFVKVLSQLMKDPVQVSAAAEMDSKEPAGQAPQRPSLLIMSTISRTLEAYTVAIVGAEYVTRAVPAGTHDWRKFITPQELTLMAAQAGLEAKMMAGMGLTMGGLLKLTEDTSVNYIASFAKRQ